MKVMESRAPFPALGGGLGIPSETVLSASVGCRERTLLVHQLPDLNT